LEIENIGEVKMCLTLKLGGREMKSKLQPLLVDAVCSYCQEQHRAYRAPKDNFYLMMPHRTSFGVICDGIHSEPECLVK
jgi:hypothetical protein